MPRACEHRRQAGFTLVELMVVLAIMAGLMTVATFSASTTQDRARADKTIAMGRQVVADLERSDGPSFVSDFGRLPRTADEIKFLFSRHVTDSDKTPREAATHQFRTLELPEIAVGAPPGSIVKLEKAFGEPVLGVGWRGPYSLATELRQETEEKPSEFLDAWKNEWEVRLEGAVFSGLRSPGRDGQVGGTDWQDRDLDIPLRRSPEGVDLQGQIILRAADGTEYTTEGQFGPGFTLRVVYFTPDFLSDTHFAANASTKNLAAVEFTWNGAAWINPSGRGEAASATPFQFCLSGLTAGHRSFFVYAFGTPATEGNAKLYGGGVRLIHLQPGTNRTEFRLTEL